MVSAGEEIGETHILRTERFREACFYFLTAVGSIAVTVSALKLWLADWAQPWSYSGDAVFGQSLVKTVLETGWYEVQPLLNAPSGQVLHDYKIADNLLFVFAKAASIFSANAFFVVNVYFFLGFLLAGLSAFWFFRLLKITRLFASVLAILFAIAPYHFARGEVHLILGAYWPLPLALGLVYLIATNKSIWRVRTARGGFAFWGAGSAVMTIVALLLVGSANSYYAFFILLFVAVFGLSNGIRSRSWVRFWGAVGAGLFLVATMIVNMLPDMLFSMRNGENFTAVQRTPFGVEFYSLRLTELILPNLNGRIPALSAVRTWYMSVMQVGGEQPILGFVAAIGFVTLLALSFYLLFSASRPRVQPGFFRPRFAVLAAMALFAFLLGTIGGLSSIIAFFTSDLRGWNRISILIALISLAAFGLLAQVFLAKISHKFSWRARSLKISTAALAIVILGVGYFDQATPGVVPDYVASAAASTSDQKFVDAIAAAAGPDAKIVQFPYRGFPETAATNGVSDTEQLKPFMHSSTLQWTSGGVKGRPTSEWVRFLEELGPKDAALAARAAGFAGILVDSAAYPNQGTEMINALEGMLGTSVVADKSGRYQFFSLVPLDVTLESQYSPSSVQSIASLVVEPILVTMLPAPSSYNGTDSLKKYQPQLLLDNPRSVSGSIRVTFRIQENVGTSQLSLQGPSGEVARFEAGRTGNDVTFITDAPPGRSSLYFTVVGGALLPVRNSATPALELVTLSSSDPELAAVLSSSR
jgi:hypothetical protein